MATDEILRLHYYERQYLGAADLEDQQTYLRDMRRRHNLGPHTWGIVTGLDLTEALWLETLRRLTCLFNPAWRLTALGAKL